MIFRQCLVLWLARRELLILGTNDHYFATDKMRLTLKKRAHAFRDSESGFLYFSSQVLMRGSQSWLHTCHIIKVCVILIVFDIFFPNWLKVLHLFLNWYHIYMVQNQNNIKGAL